MNGISDHDAQIINLNLNTLYDNKSHEYQNYFKRNINKYATAEFQNSLSYKSWDQVFDVNDVIKIFTYILNYVHLLVCYLNILFQHLLKDFFMPITH